MGNGKRPKIRFPEFTDDWEQRKLGDIYTERNEKGDDSLQILSVSIHTGVSDTELDEDALGKTVRRSKDKSTYKHVYFGDLVFNMMRAWQGAIGVAKSEGMISPAYISAIPSDAVYPLFMDYALRRKATIEQIDSLSYGVTDFRKRLYWNSFVKVKCNIPSMEEQHMIWQFFKLLDNLIILYQQKVGTTKKLKKSMLQKMFPKDDNDTPEIRFPEFVGSWERRKLVDIVRLYQPATISAAQCNENGKYPVFGANGFIGRYDEKNHDTDQVCVSCRGANCGTVNYVTAPVWITGNSMVCNTDSEGVVDKKCFYYAMCGINFLPVITGGAQPQITRDKLQEVIVSLPDIEEQKQIGEFFSNLDNLITLHQRNCDRYKSLKTALLQQMFV